MKIFLALLLMLALTGCGGAGQKESSGNGLSGPLDDIFGSITSSSGIQSYMQGWIMAMVERNTGICRISEIDNAGLFTLRNVNIGATQTLVLLSPDFIVQSVLSIPGPVDGTLYQFFRVDSPTLPRIIHKGPIITLQSTAGLVITRDLASDSNGDLIPDGSVSLGSTMLTAAQPIVDLDVDGTPNHLDPDIDGDGIINVFDPDDDGDNILDVFDLDANGDLVNDQLQTIGDFFFPEGVEFIALQYETKPAETGPGMLNTLKFTTKVRADVAPVAVQITGAPSLLNGANITTFDESGNEIEAGWNRQIMDDGLSEDSNAGDRIFGKKVILAPGAAPRAHETIFFELVFDSNDPWYFDLPYTFPDLKLQTNFKTTIDPISKTVGLSGNPFGTVQDFVWLIYVYNAEGKSVWVSPPIQGVTRSYRIQANVLDPAQTYTYSVVSQVLDKVPGYPSYAIHSEKKPISK